MLRRIWIAVSVAGLAITVGCWLAASVLALSSREREGWFVCAGTSDGWLAVLVVSVNGAARAQYFSRNHSAIGGIHVGALHDRLEDDIRWHTFRRFANPISKGIELNLTLPLLLFAAMTGHALGLPVVRRALRRRRRACLVCGYDMRQGTSPTCPECAYQNKYLRRSISVKQHGRTRPAAQQTPPTAGR